MKRCPQCLFIYPDSDARCDFDNTPLVVVDEAEIDAATSQTAPRPKAKRTSKKRSREVTAIVAVVGLLMGIGAVLAYDGFNQLDAETQEIPPVAIVAHAPVAIPQPKVEVLPPVGTPSPSPSPAASLKPSAERVATSHSRTTAAPVSTSGPGLGKKPGGKPVILLTTGARIDADEVWRTPDGIWYRRGGVVTLLKRNKVKAIIDR